MSRPSYLCGRSSTILLAFKTNYRSYQVSHISPSFAIWGMSYYFAAIFSDEFPWTLSHERAANPHFGPSRAFFLGRNFAGGPLSARSNQWGRPGGERGFWRPGGIRSTQARRRVSRTIRLHCESTTQTIRADGQIRRA